MSWPMMPPAGSGNCTVASAQVSLAVMWSLSLPLVSPGENCFSVSLITSQLLTTLSASLIPVVNVTILSSPQVGS